MGEVKNLTALEAIEKIKELAEGKMCMFLTSNQEMDVIARPMSTAQVDERGTIWFFSDKHSRKNQHIDINPRVYLMYIEAGKQHFLSLTAEAEVVFDQRKVDELWSFWLKAWFPDGKDDPNISLIKVTPLDGQYWDEKDNHIISTIKTGLAAITGTKGMDGSLQGDLNV